MIQDPTGVILIIIGLLFFIKPLVVWFIELQNAFRGTQSNISLITIWYYRIFGLAAIIVGCVVMFGKK
jgi:hypothetical protein